MTMIFIYDEKEASIIKKAVQLAFPFEKITIICDYDEALKAALSEEYDMFVVNQVGDLHKSGNVTGIKFIRKLRRFEQYKYTDIVLTADYPDSIYIINQGLFCCDILSAPIDINKAVELFRFIIGRRRSLALKNRTNEMVLTFKRYNHTEFLHPGNIIFTEKNERRLTICTGSNRYSMDVRRAGNIVERLINYGFVQVNRSEYVNPDYIAGYNDKELIMIGLNETIHVTASGMGRLSDAFNINL